mgnify:CR=1 FL=1
MNDVSEKLLEKRRTAILETLEKNKIQKERFLEFYTPCPEIEFSESQIDPSQYQKLEELINSRKPVPLKAISEKR